MWWRHIRTFCSIELLFSRFGLMSPGRLAKTTEPASRDLRWWRIDVLDPSDIVVAFYGMAMAHTALLKAAMGVSQQGLLFNSSVGGKQKLGGKWWWFPVVVMESVVMPPTLAVQWWQLSQAVSMAPNKKRMTQVVLWYLPTQGSFSITPVWL